MKFCLLLFGLLAQDGTRYTAGGGIQFPENYREWVFLSSGSGMTYGPAAAAREGAPLFDNVFVNPSSYRAFLSNGRWPPDTAFVLEIRKSESHGSINREGHYQAGVSAIEMEVKNAKGEWKFYGFDQERKVGKLFPESATCYACHRNNTAVENTFVQFYPVLMEVAERNHTVKKDYMR